MKWLSFVAILLALETVPAISVTPDSGEPGTQFVVTGNGFEPGERVKVLWDGANLGGTTRIDADGTFRYSGMVPDPAAPGAHTIEVEALGSGASSATASFTVTTAPASTSPTVISTTTLPTTAESPTAVSTTISGAGSPTAGPQTTETTTSHATASTASTSSGEFGSTLTDSEAGSDETTEPLGGPDGTSAKAGDAPGGDVPAGDVQTGSSGERDARSSGELIVALAVIGSVAAATYLFWGRTKRDPEEVDQFPPSEEAAQPAPLSAADVYTNEDGWVREMMDLTPPGEITSPVATSGAIIGVGTAIEGGGAAETSLWKSDDGVAWEGVAKLGVLGAAVPILWRDDVLVTVSYENGGQMSTACWRSADGYDWEQLKAAGADASFTGVSLEGVVALDEVLVAWGRDEGAPGVWFCRDGSDWQRSALLGGFDLIANTGNRLLAFGRDLRERRPLIASSDDGISWDEVDARQSRMVFEGASVSALTPFQGGVVAAGTDVTRGSGAVWVSDDGTGWYRTPFDPAVGTSIDQLSAVGDRLLAVGTDTGRSRAGRGMPIIWESYDAISWNQVSVPEGIFSEAAVTSVLLSGESILACGTLRDKREGAELASIPVSWRWAPEQEPPMDSGQGHDSIDRPIEEDIEAAVGGGARRV